MHIKNKYLYCLLNVSYMFTFSEQYRYSIVYMHLVAKLNIKLMYENVRNGKLHDSVIIFCHQRRTKEFFLYI
jgi:hypothetical protein